MSLLTKFLAFYNRSGLRGSYRLTTLLANRLASLQSVPIATPNGTVYGDLRISSATAILANPDSQSGEDLVMKACVRPGTIVYDIGAHFGFYTVLLSELVGPAGRVLAFEPNTELLPSLRRSLEPKINVTLFELALSDTNGTTELFVPEDASMASIRNWTLGVGGDVHKLSCELRRLDDLIVDEGLPFPDFIKCDVEGAELSIFKGATTIFDKKDAPVVMFEVISKAASAFGNRTADYLDFLRSFELAGYHFFEVDTRGISRLQSYDIEYANVVAVPLAKLGLCENILI